MAETLKYTPPQVEAALPERRLSISEKLIANLAPGMIPPELDNALSLAVIRRMSKN
jgi:hypothetical protein